MKTKFVRQHEARERKLLTLPARKDRLLTYVRSHHEDTSNSWTLKRLKAEVEGFHALLRELDQVWGDESFFVFRDRVMLSGDNPPLWRAPQRQCIYCLAQFGKQHVAPCAVGADVAHYDAIYKDR